MNHKPLLIIGGLLLAIIAGSIVGFWLLSSTKTASLPPSSLTQNNIPPAPNAPLPSGKLEIIKKTGDSNALDFNVVYADTQPAPNIQGFVLHLFITPTSISLSDSQIQAGASFGNKNYKLYFQSVKKVGDQLDVTIQAFKDKPNFNLTLQTGDPIASIHLAAAKRGDYKVTFDTNQTKVLNGDNAGNINNVVGTYVDAILTVD